jgi:hypothetical protein
MKGARALAAIAWLALAGIAGIVGMLLTEGAWNAAFFVLAALPLLAGLRWRLAAARARRAAAR